MTTAAKKAPVRKKAPAKAAAAATSSKDVKAAAAATSSKDVKATAAASPAEEAKTPAAEPKAAAPKARKTAGEAPAVAAGLFAMPSFDMPTSLASHEMTDLAEKSIANARDLYEQAKSSFEDQTSAVEKSFELATESSRDIQGKMVDAARANMDAGFSFLNGLIAAKSISEAIELQTSFAAKQFETLSAQGKDIQDCLTKSMEEATVPMKAAAGKAMESLKITG